jgi:LuxR family maltose regulon positive regulatory protein
MIVRPLALSEQWDDNDDVVRHAEVELMRDAERRLSFEGTRACGTALAGRPVDALRIAAGVRHAAAVTNMSILHTELAVAEALAHRELGDRSRGVAQLEVLADTPAEAMLYCRVLAMIELAHDHLDAGGLDEAWARFGEAQALVESARFGPDVHNWLARVATRLCVADGDLVPARRWAEQIDDPFWRGIGVARVQLAAGDRAGSAAALDTTVSRCPRHSVVSGLLRAHVVDDHEEAMKHAESAIELAAEHGMLQTVVAEGPQAVEFAERAGWRVPADWLDRLRRTIAEIRVQPSPHRAEPIEPLTDRERDVLRFLPSRLTVREIADELYVSVNTLKFHLKVIYRKLGVSSRAEAAEVARRMMSIHR